MFSRTLEIELRCMLFKVHVPRTGEELVRLTLFIGAVLVKAFLLFDGELHEAQLR